LLLNVSLSPAEWERENSPLACCSLLGGRSERLKSSEHLKEKLSFLLQGEMDLKAKSKPQHGSCLTEVATLFCITPSVKPASWKLSLRYRVCGMDKCKFGLFVSMSCIWCSFKAMVVLHTNTLTNAWELICTLFLIDNLLLSPSDKDEKKSSFSISDVF